MKTHQKNDFSFNSFSNIYSSSSFSIKNKLSNETRVRTISINNTDSDFISEEVTLTSQASQGISVQSSITNHNHVQFKDWLLKIISKKEITDEEKEKIEVILSNNSSFLVRNELFEMLSNLYDSSYSSDSNEHKDLSMNLIKNIFYIITQWQSIFSDVPSHEVNDFSLKIIFFMEKILKGKGNTFESIKTSRNTVLLSNNNSTFPNKKYKNFKNFNSRPISLTPSEANTSNSKRNFFLFDWDEFEITRQLCLGTSHLLLKLNVNEILKYSFSSLIFNGNNNQFDSIKPLLKRYSNLKSLFIDEILSYSLPSQRAFLIEKLINISTYLSEMRNLNDLYCLLDVLSSPLIKNLSITWKYVNKKNLFKYSSLYKTFKNDENDYKQVWDSINDSIKQSIPFIPPVGLVLMTVSDVNSIRKNDLLVKNDKEILMLNTKSIDKIMYLIDVVNKSKLNGYMFRPVIRLSYLYCPVTVNSKLLNDLSYEVLVEEQADYDKLSMISVSSGSVNGVCEEVGFKRETFNEKYNTLTNKVLDEIIESIKNM